MGRKDVLVAGFEYAAFGVEFATIIVVTAWLGYRTDAWLGTTPWLMLLFVLAGMVGALQRLLWSLKRRSSRQSNS